MSPLMLLLLVGFPSIFLLIFYILFRDMIDLVRIKEGTKFVIVTPAGKQIIQIKKNGIWQFYSKYPNANGDCEEYWM